VFLKVKITSLSLNGRRILRSPSSLSMGEGEGEGVKFDNLNISPSPKIPSHKGRGVQM